MEVNHVSSGNSYCVIQVQYYVSKILSPAVSSPHPSANGFTEIETSSTLVFKCCQGYTPQTALISFCVARDIWTSDPVNFKCVLESHSK